ncbi:Inositol-1-monophosphatase [hydrothermal vent metagenome]|uniref:Inositol-1-monophosphatase n=1 Tax=hydrothermal vent metagenome TaxID=652676 RepID=A0A3B0VD07_9ZZZZ
MIIPEKELTLYQHVACETAVSAGHLAREMFSQPRQIKNKGFRDIVTDADFATQLLITNAIQQAFPDHGFLTEEEDSQLPESGPIIWIIDPIDGTTNYSRQFPEFCVSIAACIPTADGFIPVAAAIYDPMRQELFSAAQGQGATVQFGDKPPRPTQVSSVANAADGLLCIDWSSSANKRASILQLLNELAPKLFTIRAIGTAALAMAWVAAGRVDTYLNLNLRPWDVAAALLLVQESGGSFTAPSGNPLVWDVAGMACLVSNGRIQLDLPPL